MPLGTSLVWFNAYSSQQFYHVYRWNWYNVNLNIDTLARLLKRKEVILFSSKGFFWSQKLRWPNALLVHRVCCMPRKMERINLNILFHLFAGLSSRASFNVDFLELTMTFGRCGPICLFMLFDSCNVARLWVEFGEYIEWNETLGFLFMEDRTQIQSHCCDMPSSQTTTHRSLRDWVIVFFPRWLTAFIQCNHVYFGTYISRWGEGMHTWSLLNAMVDRLQSMLATDIILPAEWSLPREAECVWKIPEKQLESIGEEKMFFIRFDLHCKLG